MHVVACGAGQDVARNADAVSVAGQDQAGIGVSVDAQGDGIADRHIGADRAGNRHQRTTGAFRTVDGGDRIDRDAGWIADPLHRIGLIGTRARAVASRIDHRHARMHAVERAGRQHIAGNADAVAATSLHCAAVVVAIDGQGDRVADRHIAADRAGDGNRRGAGCFRRGDRGDRRNGNADRRRR